MNDPLQILKTSKSILLIDWPNPNLPRTLLKSGFAVYCFSPNQYTKAELMPYAPAGIDIKNIFKPEREGDEYLVFARLSERLPSIDIVYVYRPEKELPGIIAEHVLPLEAKSIWIDPPSVSEATQKIVEDAGLNFIGYASIVETANKLTQ